MAGFLANKSIAQADVQTTLTCHMSHSFDLFLSGRIPSVVGGRVNFLFDLFQKNLNYSSTAKENDIEHHFNSCTTCTVVSTSR